MFKYESVRINKENAAFGQLAVGVVFKGFGLGGNGIFSFDERGQFEMAFKFPEYFLKYTRAPELHQPDETKQPGSELLSTSRRQMCYAYSTDDRMVR